MMERKTAADFDPEVLRWFDRYVHGQVDRRGFLDGVARYAVGGVTATMLLEALNPRFAEAQQVAKDDKRIDARFVDYASPDGSGRMRGYLVRPAGAAGKLPGVLVVHENRGLNPHIEDIARRLALADFVAFAPDALTPLGGYPAPRMRRASCSPSSIRRSRARISSPARNSSRGCRNARGASASSASATAAPSPTISPPGCPSSPPWCRSTAASRPRRKR